MFGLYVSPDIDTILYLFSGMLDMDKFWGIKNDTFQTLTYLDKLGYETWFKIGDRDFATHIFRTEQLSKGMKISEITREIREYLKIEAKIFPSSDTHIETRIITRERKNIHFQEFWVKEKGQVNIKEVYVENIENADPPDCALNSIDESTSIIIGPSNPITSIKPIVDIDRIRTKLIQTRERVIAISPIIGGAPISGPTAQLMRTKNLEVSSLQIAKLYQDICSTFIIDRSEKDTIPVIERETGLDVLAKNILFKDSTAARNLAEFILGRGKLS
jgi:LPPG:FO 2-phospho-L-lactate transferase